MLRRHRSHFGGQSGSSHLCNLIRVNLWSESVVLALLEHSTGLLQCKGRLFTENVAELRETLFRDATHELVARDQIHIGGAVRAVLRRQGMRSEISGDEIDGLQVVETLNGLEHLDLVLNREAVAALDLERRHTVREHARESRQRQIHQLVEARFAYRGHGALDAASALAISR